MGGGEQGDLRRCEGRGRSQEVGGKREIPGGGREEGDLRRWGGGGEGDPTRWGEGKRRYLTLHCHHQNVSCVKMGSGVSYIKVPLIVRGQKCHN